MRSVVLVPYCPLPSDTGGKVEMWKYLDVLRELGPCKIASANTKPVGCGWTAESRRKIEDRGFEIVLREEECPSKSWRQWAGIAYASICKGLRFEKAFGHSNPYHRYAFPADWWYRHTQNADVALIHYSYWAWLPCACPKVIALLDIWSDFMREGPERETRELQTADLVTVISLEEKEKLMQRGLENSLWSPPSKPFVSLPDSSEIGLLGSPSAVNREGLRWLGNACEEHSIKVFGGIAKFAHGKGFNPIGPYADPIEPYKQCGIILMTTAQGMGVQIKGIEALAAGRAIIARRGAMRGLPPGNGAWLEVDTPEEMLVFAKKLQEEPKSRNQQMKVARAYCEKYLATEKIQSQLKNALIQIHNHA